MWFNYKSINKSCRLSYNFSSVVFGKIPSLNSTFTGNNREVFKKPVNMTYCRWLASKRFMEYVPSLCYVQNGSISTRTYTTLQSNHNANYSRNSIINNNYDLPFNNTTNNLWKKQSQVLNVYLRHLHNDVGNKTRTRSKTTDALENTEDYDVFGQEDSTRTVIKNNAYDKNLIFHDCVSETEPQYNPEQFENKDHEKISQIFPSPKETLNNLKTMLGSNIAETFQKQKVHTSKAKGKKTVNIHGDWKTTLRLTWPTTMIFESESMTKSHSGNMAAMKAVHWLYVNKHVDEKGYPIHSSSAIKEMKQAVNRPVQLHIDFKEETAIKTLFKMFTSTVEPFIKEASAVSDKEALPITMPEDMSTADIEDLVDSDLDKSLGKNIHNMKLASEMEYTDPLYGMPPQDKDSRWMGERSEYLKSRLQYMLPEKQLPIVNFKDKILETVRNNRVVVIRGAPGCGKSTRTPSYILNDWIAQGVGAECNIIVSQPRRVAALSLASTVSQDRGDHQIGDTVGHQVRLSTRLPKAPGGGILYCTAGALLRKLATSPALPGCSHLILDEAHERSADSDAVMTLAKRALDLNPRLKVIIMSATIDTQLFSRYYNDCPILDIPGFSYPVQSHYLDDVKSLSGLHLFKTVENTQIDNERANVDAREVVQVLRWLHKSKPEGAMLVFLPGWQTIKKVKEEMEENYNDGSWVVLPVHSRLSNEDQRKIFDRPMQGIRKIVLATNIAETSITIDDVVYVIDTGVHKEHRLIADKGISSLDADWVSRSSVAQRRGRAGRVKPGECYHLYTKEKMETFVENNIPEILRIPLEKTVLDCKTYNEGAKAQDFLGQFPQPPSRTAIDVAVQDLIEMGALDKDERLTALGRRIASYTTHPKISKALVYSTIFKVASPIIDLSAILSNNIDIYSCSVQNRSSARIMKTSFHPTSDHMALYWLCRNFEDMMAKKTFYELINYCKRNYIRMERIKSVFDLRKICVEHLKQSRMLLPHLDEASHNLGEVDTYSKVDELVKGVLLSGLNTLLTTKYIIKTRGKLSKERALVSDQGQKAFLTQTSVNQQITKTESDAFLLYCGAVHSQERRGLLVRDVSLVHPLTVFLFSQNINLMSNKDGKTKFTINSSKISLECDEDQAQCLMKLREMMWTMAQYYIENKGFTREYDADPRLTYNTHRGMRRYDREEHDDTSGDNSNNPVDKFRNELLYFIADLLNKVEIVSLDKLEKDDE